MFSGDSFYRVGFPMPIPFFGSEATSEDPTTSTSQSETASTPHAGNYFMSVKYVRE